MAKIKRTHLKPNLCVFKPKLSTMITRLHATGSRNIFEKFALKISREIFSMGTALDLRLSAPTKDLKFEY